jgi:hypothetical protein
MRSAPNLAGSVLGVCGSRSDPRWFLGWPQSGFGGASRYNHLAALKQVHNYFIM